MIHKFKRNFIKKRKIDVIGVGDIIQFNGGNAYIVKRLNSHKHKSKNNKIYLEPYRGYHPVSFPGDNPYEGKSWESIRHLNYEMKQKLDCIFSVTKTKQSEEPDFYHLSIDAAHKRAIDLDKSQNELGE